ncbi:conserved hypothetical protein [uncultured Pleomorphomonas sp.]|uniref:3-oxo-tetronate kinase n=1 Tax=uncultured Pleomorphomonas sp. TaxID=442121 RepID=A0A212LGD4_9HYPH|nr:3-oxo-tetronate kinase [uncultured Pleomorphomonas sp.]SCM76527.1 conserved hypothetical protein [uncultured Pleomorphomonas sp.]
MLLGCIGDDFTGSSDLGNTLAIGGMRVVQYCGLPASDADPAVEAGIVALKSRTVAPAEAVGQSLAAADWLLAQGCRQIFFKICSTFDSRRDGNIGLVIDALMARLGASLSIVCPAFPDNGRSVYQGHLFVGDRLLSESSMRHHPLTPMSDSDIRRWLGHQSRQAVGHVAMPDVRGGADAIRAALKREATAGRPVVVVDAIANADLVEIGRAASDLLLLTGGSGLALGLPGNFGIGPATQSSSWWTGSSGPAVVLSGSCSAMTRLQVSVFANSHPAFEVIPADILSGKLVPDTVVNWFAGQTPGVAPLIYSSAEPRVVEAVQAEYGIERTALAIEAFFAALASQLAASGIERIVVAGGETSGAVVEGLGIASLEIGPQIAPGVPAVRASGRPLWLALKSGNFGDESFFEKALTTLAGGCID